MKKSTIIKTAAAMLAPISLASCQGAKDVKQQHPNIIFFLVDDMGWTETSLPFWKETHPNNTKFNTPNMHRLSEMGVMMTNAYACPVSTPTRTSLMTGMNAAHLKITSYCSLYRDICPDAIGGRPGTTNPNLDDAFAHSTWNYNCLAPDSFNTPELIETYNLNKTVFATPLPQILRDNGYFTIHVGKAHWAPNGLPGSNPQNFGYVVGLCGGGNGHPESYMPQDNFGNLPGKWTYASVPNLSQYYGSEIHLTEALTQEALKTLEYPLQEGIPFYLYFSHHSNHTPIQADNRFYQKYIDAGLDEGEARYASMVEGMDKSLGDVLDFIEEKGIADNTILIFMTDNGGDCVSAAKGGERHTQNLPLRSGKASCYEGGIRVPMMVYWKGHVAPGTRISTPVINDDYFPTILELAGVKNYTTTQTLDGRSWVSLVTKGSQAVAKAMKDGIITNQEEAYEYVLPESITGGDRDLVFHYPHQYRYEDQDDIDFLSAVRRGDWKLVYRMHDFDLELYNLREDIGERNNVAAEHPEIVAELAKALGDRLRSWDASMPIVRATGKPVPWPDELLK